jgi:hypothetical protein
MDFESVGWKEGLGEASVERMSVGVKIRRFEASSNISFPSPNHRVT